MSENIITQITLDCLINKEVYEKMKHLGKQRNVNKKDKKFYRKRISNLTRELLLKKDDDYSEINPDIKFSFDNYIKTCIQYFKIIDNNDILQEEYKDFNGEFDCLQDVNMNQPANDNTYDKEKDKLFMRSIKMPNYLEKFVKITSTKKPEEIILPKIKEIDLQEPNLRIKGIQKKENIVIK
jgi:hypothetical protein|uniref:Uncharacterized protein n=1 Tax=viral metagenome TaxID=1070528 RepID=A0A6C0D8W1_9ZZZZ